MSTNNEEFIYIFDCPEHGEEWSVFCFRALNEDNAGRWRKYRITRIPEEWEDGELEDILAYYAVRSKDDDT